MIRKDKAFITIAIIEIVFIFLAALGIWIAWENSNIQTTYIEVKDDFIPAEFDGFKIAHISDLHNKDWKGELEKLVESENPDIIVITGDVVDSSDRYYSKSVEFAENAVKIAPVYFVNGNHEAYMNDYGTLEKALIKAGVNIINDKSVFIEKNGAKINLAGIADPSFKEDSDAWYAMDYIISEKIKSLVKEDCYNIVLSHRPEYFDVYAETEANLILCGHAHGGQVRIPFVGGVIAPGQGFFPEYTEGIHTKNNTSMIVSRGLGDSVLPRVNNMPELVIITLKSS